MWSSRHDFLIHVYVLCVYACVCLFGFAFFQYDWLTYRYCRCCVLVLVSTSTLYQIVLHWVQNSMQLGCCLVCVRIKYTNSNHNNTKYLCEKKWHTHTRARAHPALATSVRVWNVWMVCAFPCFCHYHFIVLLSVTAFHMRRCIYYSVFLLLSFALICLSFLCCSLCNAVLFVRSVSICFIFICYWSSRYTLIKVANRTKKRNTQPHTATIQ